MRQAVHLIRCRESLRINSFTRNLIVMVSGTAIGQFVTFLVAPLLTRLYLPSDFGALAIYSSAVSILVVVGSLRYEYAIPLANSATVARSLARLSFLILLVFAFSVGVAIVLIHGVPGIPSSSLLWWELAVFVPLGLVGAGSYQIIYYCASRERLFDAIARTRLVQNIGMAAVQALFGILWAGPLALISGDLVGRTFGVRLLSKRVRLFQERGVGWSNVRDAAVKYKEFPRLMLWAALFNVASVQIPMLLLPQFFDLHGVGEYFLAYRILSLPISMVSAGVSQVFYAEMASSSNEAHMASVTKGLVMLICAIGLPAYAGFALSGPKLFTFIFGESWQQAGDLAQAMCPMLFLRFVGNSLSSLLMVGKRFGEAVWFTAAELLTVVAAIGIGVYAHSIYVFVLALTLLSLPLGFLSIWRFSRVVGVGLRSLLSESFLPVLLATVPILPVNAGASIFLEGVPVLVIWLLTSITVTVACLRFSRIRLLISQAALRKQEEYGAKI